MTRILGIDPGLQRTGWGVIEARGPSLSFIACGVVRSHAEDEMPQRLKSLHAALSQVIEAHRPEWAAVEETFVNKNSASSLKLAQARGAILLTLALSGLEVAAISANRIKKSVVGSGHAEKQQVAMMVRTLLPGCRVSEPDAADALATAIAGAHYGRGRV